MVQTVLWLAGMAEAARVEMAWQRSWHWNPGAPGESPVRELEEMSLVQFSSLSVRLGKFSLQQSTDKNGKMTGSTYIATITHNKFNIIMFFCAGTTTINIDEKSHQI